MKSIQNLWRADVNTIINIQVFNKRRGTGSPASQKGLWSMEFTQNRDLWRAVVNTVMNIWDP
jgi:hypothetical protein